MLRKVISGGQDGADIAGVKTAHKYKLETGGTMPKGFKTVSGDKPQYADLYGMIEHESDAYPPRTEENVKNSDATVRFAVNFDSPGEKCTLNAIKKHNKPYVDIDISRSKDTKFFEILSSFIKEHNVQVLNVAGNTPRSRRDIEHLVENYLVITFELLREQNEIKFIDG
jgi:hypothetical protein